MVPIAARALAIEKLPLEARRLAFRRSEVLDLLFPVTAFDDMGIGFGGFDPRVDDLVFAEVFFSVGNVLIEGPLKNVAVHVEESPRVGFLESGLLVVAAVFSSKKESSG